MEIFQEMSFVDDLGADSLELFQILMGVEQEFDISIDESLKDVMTRLEIYWSLYGKYDI